MTRSAHARWWQAAGLCALAVLVAVELVLIGHPLLAVPVGAALLWFAYVVSPIRPTSGSTHWQAQDRLVQHGAAVVYWRPGCRHCVTLRLRLTRERLGGRVSWVDLWADPEGAAYVRDLNDGDETVPTVILPDGSAVTNPEPSVLVEALRRGSEPRPPRPREARPAAPSGPPQSASPDAAGQAGVDRTRTTRPARGAPHRSPVGPGGPGVGADG